MAILFSITLLAFCALLWASFAVARHLRRPSHPANPDRGPRRPDHFLRGSR